MLIQPNIALRKAHMNLSRLKRGLFFKRQDQLSELTKSLAEEKGTAYMAKLKQLQNREKMAKKYRAFNWC